MLDASLKRIGLMRTNQQWVQRLSIKQGNDYKNYITIELRNGFRFSGYLTSGLGRVDWTDNPLVEPR